MSLIYYSPPFLFFPSPFPFIRSGLMYICTGQPYETDLRVPFLIRGPGIAPGRVLPAFGAEVDILPTIAELAGATIPATTPLDGRSMVSLLMQVKQTHNCCFVVCGCVAYRAVGASYPVRLNHRVAVRLINNRVNPRPRVA